MVEKLDWFESLWVWPMVWAVTPPSQPFSLLSTPSQPYPLPKSLLYNLLILPTAPCHNPTFDLKVRWAQFFIHSNEMTKLLACCRLGHVKEPVAVGEWCLVKLCGNSTNELLFSFHLFFFFLCSPQKNKTKNNNNKISETFNACMARQDCLNFSVILLAFESAPSKRNFHLPTVHSFPLKKTASMLEKDLLNKDMWIRQNSIKRGHSVNPEMIAESFEYGNFL